MVMVRSALLPLTDGNVNLEKWLLAIEGRFTAREVNQIRQACTFIQSNYDTAKTPVKISCIAMGLEIANLLLPLNADADAITASILYPALQYADLTLLDLTEQYPTTIHKLLQAALQMDMISELQGKAASTHRIDNYRRMLLSLVDDVQIVLLKLAERAVFMRHIHCLPLQEQQKTSQQIIDIYASLANRLDILELKWELEDLSFRILHHAEYKNIAHKLLETRLVREQFITDFISNLKQLLNDNNVKSDINGRAKHIYSIYKKMTRKNLQYEQIYDTLALRVLVGSIADCYQVLSLIQAHWQQIPSEFVDYIATPKQNGYQSIHTIMVTPDNKTIEIQIRTHAMHEKNELGGAAHWMYKEGSQEESYQQKIAWLRQLLEWQQEMANTSDIPTEIIQGLTEDRIYVFSPNSEVISLPTHATPLDYAYNIHTEVGHKCRGAKVNGRMIPLTYQLQTGDRVDILTGKKAAPSRDWLNSQLGYLTTPRAKGKIHAWFKKRDFDANVIEGQAIFQRELKKQGLTSILPANLFERFHVLTTDELFASLGCGDIRMPQLTGALIDLLQEKETSNNANNTNGNIADITKPKKVAKAAKSILVEGIDNLLTHIAHCCKPLPGELISGYTTLNRGVSIHRASCATLIELSAAHPERGVHVTWGSVDFGNYHVDLTLEANTRADLLRDITKILSDEKITIVGLHSYTEPYHNITIINLHLELKSIEKYNHIQHRLLSLSQVLSLKRQ